MFDVLVYVYQNYWHGDSCPELSRLERKLSAVGFASDEIRDAIEWLDGLNLAAQGTQNQDAPSQPDIVQAASTQQSPLSLRVYSLAEQEQLGASGLGFISFLESADVLPPSMREIVIDRAMFIEQDKISLDKLKLIILMVYWSLGEEPDALILDELSDDKSNRTAH